MHNTIVGGLYVPIASQAIPIGKLRPIPAIPVFLTERPEIVRLKLYLLELFLVQPLKSEGCKLETRQRLTTQVGQVVS